MPYKASWKVSLLKIQSETQIQYITASASKFSQIILHFISRKLNIVHYGSLHETISCAEDMLRNAARQRICGDFCTC